MIFFDSLKKVFGKDYSINPNCTKLSAEELRALSVGAINSEQALCFCNSLTTGLGEDECKNKMKEVYGIDSKEKALELIHEIYTRGTRYIYDCIRDEVVGHVCELKDNEIEQAPRFLANLEETKMVLFEEGFIETNEDYEDISVIAYDMGRVVMLARAMYDAKYIDEKKAWEIINMAYNECKDIYAGWYDFSKGYLVGRAMCTGHNPSFVGVISIVEGLVSDTNSPWKEVKFK